MLCHLWRTAFTLSFINISLAELFNFLFNHFLSFAHLLCCLFYKLLHFPSSPTKFAHVVLSPHSPTFSFFALLILSPSRLLFLVVCRLIYPPFFFSFAIISIFFFVCTSCSYCLISSFSSLFFFPFFISHCNPSILFCSHSTNLFPFSRLVSFSSYFFSIVTRSIFLLPLPIYFFSSPSLHFLLLFHFLCRDLSFSFSHLSANHFPLLRNLSSSFSSFSFHFSVFFPLFSIFFIASAS